MSFLTPFLLAGAAAFLIPLLIHLLNRRKVSVVRWGPMHLLQEVIRQKKRKFVIEQWLLLAIRIAIPIILALCLARPVLSALRSIPGFGKTSLVVLLDDSFSMRAPGSNGAPREQAKAAIQRLVDGLPRGSDAQVILAGGTPRKLMDSATSALDLVPKAVADAPSLAGPVAANEALQAAAAALAKAPNATREIVLMSDFQSADWKAFAEGAALPALDAMAKQEPKPSLTFYRLPNDLTENLSLASVELSALVAAETQPVGLRVRVQNHGKRAWQDIALHLEADGTRLRTTRISVPPEGETTLSLTHAFEKVGDHSLGVRLEGDTLTDDNAFQGIVHVRNQINVLLVDGSAGGAPMASALDFLEIALTPNDAVKATLKDLIKITRVDVKKLNKDKLKGMEVIILGDVVKLEGNDIRELEAFVDAGGGLLIFGGPHCDLDWYSREFYRGGKGLFPSNIKVYGRIEATENPARIVLQRFTHPATTYFNDPRGGRLQDAEFNHWLNFETKSDEVKTLLALDRGAPLIIEKSKGRGRVIACASTANAEWSTMPLQMFYLPLAQRLVTYLSTQGSAPAWQLVGQPVRYVLKDGKVDDVFVVTDPTGKTTEVKTRKESNAVIVESALTNQPGVYSVRAPGMSEESAQRFAFNLNSAESDLKPLPADDVKALAERTGASFTESFEGYEKLDRSRRHGSEFWQPFLLALLALLFGEVLLQQRIARA